MKLDTSIESKTANTSLCTLSAINWGLLESPQDLESLCDITVRMLDSLIETNVYINALAERETKASRYLGIGITNFAYFLAKNKLKYQDPAALTLVHEYAEAQMYYLLRATMNIAKEQGACENFYRTKYSKGILPIDTYSKNLDGICPNNLKLDWESLRADIVANGMRHSALMAIMPVQSSSVVSNSTNGIDPPRAYLNQIKSKHGLLSQILPEYTELKDYYTLAYEKDLTTHYLNLMAIIQKFADQGISVNTYYSPAHYEDGKVSMSEVVGHILQHYKLGGKTLYYSNTDDGRDAQEKEVIIPIEEFSDGLEAILDASENTSANCPIDPVERANCESCLL